VLRDVVEAIASHSSIERVDLVQGEYDISEWWIGNESTTIDLLKSALAENTSITDIRVKMLNTRFDNIIIDIVKHS